MVTLELSAAVQDTENDARDMAMALANIIQGNYTVGIGTSNRESTEASAAGSDDGDGDGERNVVLGGHGCASTVCQCGRVCKNKRGLKRHMNQCKFINAGTGIVV